MRIVSVFQTILISVVLGQNTGYSDAFLNIGTSSRSIAVGQSVVALPYNTGGLTVNPSATADTDNTITGLYINQFDMAEFYSIGLSTPLKNGYQIGWHGIKLSVDNIFERPDINSISNLETRRDSIRKLISDGYNSFSTSESALFFNASKQLLGPPDSHVITSLPIGINIKLIQKDLYKSEGKGIGLDIGGMIMLDLRKIDKIDLFDKLIFGLALNNFINTTIYWDSGDKDKIPMQLLGGTAYIHNFQQLPIKVTLMWQKNSQYLDENQYGTEFTVFDIISIRGGYNYGYLQGGLGLNIIYRKYRLGIDYSFSDHDLGNAHRIGGWISF